MYRVVIEYRFDWRTDLLPSWDDIVFWRDTGWKEDEEAVLALEGVCNMTLIVAIFWGDRKCYVQGSISCELEVRDSDRLLMRAEDKECVSRPMERIN